ncbi:glutamate 5-kinase [Thalassoglobus polymorphus]|uniref:Glutamate 5-kinase n=1 Tax=Thalassoglobus polymorphus TaxID=2527994 RepID=A0A517QSH5_9PLAN|nr:glutamate 5-kinase [Thalassoglobus polymorphus]QDT34579.1 Glutamate 5-kinase [Thalassoglobus polymorphus]
MKDIVRQEVVAQARTIVVKVGTNVLSREDDQLDVERISSLADQIHRIRETGRRVVVVSSGAVGAGLGLLGLSERPKDLPHLQAAAATGQASLIRSYDDALKRHGYQAAQMLLTANDFRNRDRYLNVRNTLNTLFEYGVVPIINENDTVSVKEVKFGDNDQLAVMVSNLLDCPLLVILSVVDGLFDGDPRDPASKRFSLINHCDDAMMSYALNIRSSRGTGGMLSKLQSVRMATAVGECVVIANGTDPQVLDRVLAAEDVGTLFTAKGQLIPAWKRWIGFTVKPRGSLQLDAGAVRAVEHNGKSLLPIGIASVQGSFQRGELVSICDVDGKEFARGLTNYDAMTVSKIVRKRTDELENILGDVSYTEVIHRDNLCVVR